MVNNSLTYLDNEIYLHPKKLPQIKISTENSFRCNHNLQQHEPKKYEIST